MAVITDIINYALQLGCLNEEIKCSYSLKKIRNFFMNIGIILTLFYNLPFELINFRVADVLLMIASVVSVVLTIQYLDNSKKYLKMQ